MRETWEEAGATVEVVSPFAQLDIPLIGQVRNLLTCLFLLLVPYHCVVLMWMFGCGADLCYILGETEES